MLMRGIPLDRLSYVGGSDARTILGKDENALLRLWQEKRGELAPEDLSGNLIVQFGCATEEPALVRARDGAQYRRGPTLRPPPQARLDGCDPGRNRAGRRRGVRGEVHAALELRRGRRRGQAHATSTQHVGDGSAGLSLPPDRLLPLCLQSHSR